ncbi:tRNA preQ1(34) S-adenosylmethionine ribosyltransferase-isomerase QueA [Albimonas sp. CAU 1670]|uniref:tRNA preQ1(34) S-adenosylmethionine ribosyltransferase-isomerase QueA n=1 Tax=Albimonas sp. CAU 1670 TaxID=3032599 RepID=UPI0023DB372E|nr:tRNA preQ1(34) S-adenosylmethionine ribosyltransferase-isomerase QueA [Albimonas sp. CAU 1670]MDF2232227.1 tRNA preQ1(34) S-adenosylmethionine ribosyltransferase-isomerase QueA [Albimonas sp. CAU 1670]
MRVDDFDFDLPEELIALRPVRPRSSARMLVAQDGRIDDRRVSDLPSLLRPGDLLVFNDTKVIPARLFGERRRDSADGSGVAKIEATLLSREGPDAWEALARPAKRLREGDRLVFGPPGAELGATVAAKGEAGAVRLVFEASGPALDAAIAAAGVMPLPPYIAHRRPADEKDAEDYQTVFAERPGAVAAPTASLHFDAPLLAALAAAGVNSTRLTLHVGAGTFLPVKVEDVESHKMHSEWGEVPESAAEAVNAARAAGGRVIPVGTTALRLLETAGTEDRRLEPWVGDTDIFIRPGHRFRVADGLMTNFHLPRSTLLMLVSALVGVERAREIYAHAIAQRYRFYSYGDSSLLFP